MRWTRYFAIAGAAIVCLLVGSALFGKDGLVRHDRLSEELESVEALNAKFAAENHRLEVEAEALKTDDRYIESVVRDELGWVKKDEMVFIFPTPPESEADPEQDVDGAPTDDVTEDPTDDPSAADELDESAATESGVDDGADAPDPQR